MLLRAVKSCANTRRTIKAVLFTWQISGAMYRLNLFLVTCYCSTNMQKGGEFRAINDFRDAKSHNNKLIAPAIPIISKCQHMFTLFMHLFFFPFTVLFKISLRTLFFLPLFYSRHRLTELIWNEMMCCFAVYAWVRCRRRLLVIKGVTDVAYCRRLLEGGKK